MEEIFQQRWDREAWGTELDQNVEDLAEFGRSEAKDLWGT